MLFTGAMTNRLDGLPDTKRQLLKSIRSFRYDFYIMQSDLEQAVAREIRRAWDEGCPVAAVTDSAAAKMAGIARRRWNSYKRRNSLDTTENRINDLAWGLAEKFTAGGRPMVGPLISDYRWLCEQIAPLAFA